MNSNKFRYLILTFLIISNLLAICMCNAAEDDPITIHVVPHTHDDAGWLWTVDEYYQGTGGAPMSVKRILDNFINSLNDRPDRTFIYVEMAFFTIWYKTQTEETKLQVKKLLKEGRFEFINGGYVMHDEGASYYQHIIDQMRLGLQFLKEEFDYTPEIAWFIDPFGHSSASAYLLAKMGFTKIAFVRIDYKEKDIRRATKNLEFYWVPYDEIDSEVKIFTHVTYDHYCPPGGMENFIDDRELSLPYDEVKSRSDTIYDNLKTWNSGYKHKNVMLMYGCDFTHNARDSNYKNVEAVMDYINTNKKDMKLVYSTPTKYFNSVFEQVKDWSNTYKNQDFFPYADNEYSYWTGYITSRPFLKGLVRETGNYLTSNSRFIFDYMLRNKMKSSSGFNGIIDNLFYIRENHAICQHHDAVAGTAKEKVSEDYELRLNSSIEKSKDNFNTILKDVVSELKEKEIKICISSPVSNIQCQSDLIRNTTVYHTANKSDKSDNLARYSFGLINPQLQGKYPVTIDLSDQIVSSLKGIEVRDENNEIIVSDLICLKDESLKDNLKCKLRFIYNFDKSKSMTTFSLTFLPIGKDAQSGQSGNLVKEETLLSEGDLILLNHSDLKIKFDIKNLKFKSEIKSKVYNYEILHAYYNSYNGHNSKLRPDGMNPDGAYILSTVEEMPIPFKADYSRSHVYKGNLSTLIVLRFEQSYLLVNVCHDPYIIELESIFDPITDKSAGKNFLLLVNTNINNNVLLPGGSVEPEIWTDSNGMKMMRRFKDYRQGWKYEITDKVSGNFFPVNAKISIRERTNYKYSDKDYEGLNASDRMMTIYNDRSQSGGVMTTGHLMLLVHRYSVKDDLRGVAEPIFENSSALKYFRTKHIIVFDNSVDQSYFENLYQNKPVIVSLADFNKTLSIQSDLSKLFELKKVGVDKFKFHHENSKIKNYASNSFENSFEESNLIVNYHLKSAHEIFVQVYNPSDFYFDNNISEEYITFKNLDGITYTLNEYKFNSVSPIQQQSFNDKFLYQSHIKDTSFSIKPQDFKLFLLKFD